MPAEGGQPENRNGGFQAAFAPLGKAVTIPHLQGKTTDIHDIKIISGGQTGVDRAKGAPCGGWCPQDRGAEDGVIGARYPLTPLVQGGYRRRTLKNIEESDATLIVYFGEIALKSGTLLALSGCLKQQKPFLLVDAEELSAEHAGERIARFVLSHRIRVLNVGGPRASVQPTAHAYTQQAVEYALGVLFQAGSDNG